MRFFRTEPPAPNRPLVVPDRPAAEAPKPPIIEGWSEDELASVYDAAPARHLKKGDKLFLDVPRTDSFVVVFVGAIEITLKLNEQPGRSEVFQKGACVAPLLHYPGLSYGAGAVVDSTVVEISPSVLKHLSDEA